MKKIMTIMASLATTLFAFGALGDVSAPPAGFESYNSGDGFDPSVQEGESTYWYAEVVDDTNIITNYAESGTSVPSLPTDVVRPDGMKENDAYPSNSKFLSLETSKPLFRSVQANNQDGTFTGSTIGESGIYLDTLVKFTASEDEFKDGALEANVDKIAIEYVDQTTDETIQNPIKAFVIRAGYIGSNSLFQTNYYAYLPDDKTFQNFDVNAWHRLTVRTIANIGGNNVGFIVYLDQKPLAYDEDCGDDFSPSTDVLNYYNGEIHAVYPSAVGSGTGKNTIAAVAFSGNGAIDDVVFTTETPNFITASESVIVPFVADAGVTAISVTVAGVADPIPVVNGAATLPAQTTAFTVNVTVDGANGYTFGSITVGETDYDTNPASVTGYNGGDITITTVRSNFTYLDGDDNEQTASTLTDAFAGVKNGGTITMNYAYNLADYEGMPTEGTVVFTIQKSCVLDLNGQTLNCGSSDDLYLFRPDYDCEFTVIDSATAGKIIYGGTKGIFDGNMGDVFVGSITLVDNGPTFDGSLIGAEGYVTQIWRGKFSADENTDGQSFVGNFALGDPIKCTAALDVGEEYWVVTYNSGEEPTEIAIPTAATGLVYDGTEQTGVAAGEGYTLSGDFKATNAGEYTAIATPATGYSWSDGSTEATNIVWSIAKASVTATVSLTVTEATYDSAKTVVTDYTTPSVNFGLGAPTLVEDTDYTVAWSATEVSGAGTFTYTVSPVANSNYTFTEASATLTITAESSYPSYIDPTDTDETAKYTAWATYAEVSDVATGEVNVEAYLLNCKPSEVAAAKAAFKFTSISYDSTQSKWVTPTTTSYNNRDYNGEVVVKQYSDVGCTTESSTGTFFKAVLQ